MIVCVGTTPVYQRSMVFERLVPDDVNRATEVSAYASGKSVNVARVLHTLGERPELVGFEGGLTGTALALDLKAAGIPHCLVNVGPPTRECITLIDRSAGTATELVEEARAVFPDDWQRLDELLDNVLPGADACVLS